jgi:Zyg-11 family protein
MFVSPQTLRDYCLDFLRQRIDASVTCEGLNGALAEELLRSLSLHSQLSDDVLLKPLFDARNTRLHAVHFDDASQLTTRGLRALRAHRLRGLTVRGLSRATINELIGCLGDQSLHDLRALDVSRSAFTNHNKVCTAVTSSPDL